MPSAGSGTYNRMDRYISLRYKGLGVAKINQESIRPSTTVGHVHLVKGTVYADREYEVDTQKWTCTCTVSRTGYPSGEPCKHQHAVANKQPQIYFLILMLMGATCTL